MLTFNRTDINVGSLTDTTSVGDFNGDGNVDIATYVGRDFTTQSVLIGDGEGNFTLLADTDGVDLSTSSEPRTGDFNGDGNSDTIDVSYTISYAGTPISQVLSVQLGDGNGGVASSQVVFEIGFLDGRILSAAVADFNGDGKSDIVIAEDDLSRNDKIAVLLNTTNIPPVAEDDRFTTNENSSISIDIENDLLANDSDPDGDSLTILSVDNTNTKGIVSFVDLWGAGATITYDPNGEFEDLNDGEDATDSFSYTISDGNGGESTATVTIAIDGVSDNSAPTFNSPNVATVDENQTFAIDVNANDDNDSEGDGLTYSISGEDAGLFNINELGEINFNEAPDFENPGDADFNNDYLLEVSVSDSQGLITSQDLTINVSDVEEDNGGGNGNGTEGTNGNDFLVGTGQKDTIDGGRGNDTIDGGGANDSLIGGNGSDSLIGGAANDTLDGGNGKDFLDGGNGKDFLDGGNGNDTLDGGVNQDTLIGAKGQDFLDGGGGSDSLSGGNGFDTLIGGAANDTLDGGSGQDNLEGGKGRDVFVLAPDSGTDTIIDFELNRDTIGLSSGLSFGDLSFEGDKIISDGDTLAVLTGIDTNSLDADNFT